MTPSLSLASPDAQRTALETLEDDWRGSEWSHNPLTFSRSANRTVRRPAGRLPRGGLFGAPRDGGRG